MAVAGPGPRESEAASQAHPEESRCLWGSARRPQLAIGAPSSLAGPGRGALGGESSLVPGPHCCTSSITPLDRRPSPALARGPSSPAPRSRSAPQPGAAPAGAGPARGLRPWLRSVSECRRWPRRWAGARGSAGGAGGGQLASPRPGGCAQAPHSAGPPGRARAPACRDARGQGRGPAAFFWPVSELELSRASGAHMRLSAEKEALSLAPRLGGVGCGGGVALGAPPRGRAASA